MRAVYVVLRLCAPRVPAHAAAPAEYCAHRLLLQAKLALGFAQTRCSTAADSVLLLSLPLMSTFTQSLLPLPIPSLPQVHTAPHVRLYIIFEYIYSFLPKYFQDLVTRNSAGGVESREGTGQLTFEVHERRASARIQV
ncbi:hypothetical protein B0H16DRAFT_411282 [Mycena metata]|uniref:Uncharacterized protein n=1 Tax=Mycena metata TaxID=1033252 RepID=A0AAD7HG60_9AGAR|nr:hypothetical protein B0H16DRAFT_411282 [Mycena metata]